MVPARTLSGSCIGDAAQRKRQHKVTNCFSFGKTRTTSLAILTAITNMEVEHLLVTNCRLAWATSCWNEKNEEGRQRVWTFPCCEKAQLEGLQRTRQLSTHVAVRFEHEVAAVWRLHFARQQVCASERVLLWRCQKDADHLVERILLGKMGWQTWLDIASERSECRAGR